jgi:SAM-dependent methyltransferase
MSVEITDLLWDRDPVTGARRPVRRDAVVRRLAHGGQRRAARIAARLPATDGLLTEADVDGLMLRVHLELQRLGEELQLPRRVAETLGELLQPLREEDPDLPVRVVDIGCGLGYVLRWLAARGVLGPGVEFVGVDLNATLMGHAARLAATEDLPCRFVTGDALRPGTAVTDPRRTVVISTGLLHHLPVAELSGFFAAHQRLGVAAFAHWDADPSPWATVGAWVFHRSRMREAVSRHDGVLSARRAHPATRLLPAAQAGAPGYDVRCADTASWCPRLSEVFRPVVGVRRPAWRR